MFRLKLPHLNHPWTYCLLVLLVFGCAVFPSKLSYSGVLLAEPYLSGKLILEDGFLATGKTLWSASAQSALPMGWLGNVVVYLLGGSAFTLILISALLGAAGVLALGGVLGAHAACGVIGALVYVALSMFGPFSWDFIFAPLALYILLRHRGWDLILGYLLLSVIWIQFVDHIFLGLPLLIPFLITTTDERPRREYLIITLLLLILVALHPNPLAYVGNWFEPGSVNFRSRPLLALAMCMAIVCMALARFNKQLLALMVVSMLVFLWRQNAEVLFSLSLAVLVIHVLSVTLPPLRRVGLVAFSTLAVSMVLLKLFYFTPELYHISSARELVPHVKDLAAEFKKREIEFRIFNQREIGAELALGAAPVFIDNRRAHFELALERDYLAINYLGSDFEEVFKRWRFTAAVVSVDSGLLTVLTERYGWVVVSQTDVAYQKQRGRLKPIGYVLLSAPVLSFVG